MKKFVTFLFISTILSCACMAKEEINAPTLRLGNKYIVGTETLNKRAYRGYLQNTCPEAFSHFDKGYKTAMAGWGLFGAGPVLSLCVGFPMYITSDPCGHYSHNMSQEERDALYHRSEVQGGFALGFICLGAASFVSGIVCVSVGYSQMHQAADIYNHYSQHSTYLTIEGQGNQVSLALHF